MNLNITRKLIKSLVVVLLCLFQTNLWAVTEIHVETAGTLSSLLTDTERKLKLTPLYDSSPTSRHLSASTL